MNLITYVFFLCFCILNGQENYVRLAVIPEYEQNLVTVLVSVTRTNLDEKKEFGFTLPENIDTVYSIIRDENNRLSFNTINYKKLNERNWVYLQSEKEESAFMIITKKYSNNEKRTFSYRLSFSEIIEKLELELQQPLVAKNFNYQGFLGNESIEEHGQKFYRKTLLNFSAFENLSISFTYNNSSGSTTKEEIDNILNIDNNKKVNIEENKKKVKRYNLYIWETLIAFFSICFFILIILSSNNDLLKCVKCGHKKRKFDDLFCSKCGEKY